MGIAGRRIIELQASLHMIAASAAIPEPTGADPWGREPFEDRALAGLAGLTLERKRAVLDKKRMAQLAKKYGMIPVLRWKPKFVCCHGSRDHRIEVLISRSIA